MGARLSPANTFGGVDDPDRRGVFSSLVGELARFELAYLHFVEPRVRGSEDAAGFDDQLFSRHFKGLLKGRTRLISAGGHTRESGALALAEAEADAIAYGRQFIANPDLVRRFAEGQPLNPYDRASFYGGTERGYTDYPVLVA